MIKKLRSLIGDSTFLEAYERTGRILNVTVCPADTNEPPRLLNYLTAPNALIWSAVAASSAFPGLYPAQHILARNSRGEIIKCVRLLAAALFAMLGVGWGGVLLWAVAASGFASEARAES